jgi:hypothetical protein
MTPAPFHHLTAALGLALHSAVVDTSSVLYLLAVEFLG